LDTMGVAAIGSTTELSDLARKGALAVFGTGNAGGARILMDGRTLSPAGAAMAGAFMVDSIDAHDGTSPNKGHAGSAIFPALLAVADAMRANGTPITGRDFATWLAVAYEISYRAGQVQHATCADYHTSGAWTAVGVAAACARMLSCDGEAIRHAAGIGEYHGPRSQMMRCIDAPTMVKDGSGWGSMSGVSAAYLAKDGFTGAPAITMEDPALSAHWADLGSKWYVEEQYIKLYPVCRWAQPAAEGVLALVRQHAITPDQVEAIKVESFHEAKRLNAIPSNTEQAQYSLPFSVAAALARGTIGVKEVTENGLNDPIINDLANRVEISETDEFNAAFPAYRIARVHLHMKDGSVFSSEDTQALGDPENKISSDVLWEKFLTLTTPVKGADWSERFLAEAQALPDASSARKLFDLLE